MLIQRLFELQPRTKVIIEVLWDAASITVALLLAYLIRMGLDSWQFSTMEWAVVGANILLTVCLLMFFGHYKQMIRYIQLGALYTIFMSFVISVCYLLVAKFALEINLPVAVPFIYLMIGFMMVSAPRLLIQAAAQSQSYRLREKCIIYGASDSGRQLASTLLAGTDLLPVAFIDDKRTFQGKTDSGDPGWITRRYSGTGQKVWR